MNNNNITPESVLAAFDTMLAKSDASFDRRMKKLSEQIGGLSNNHGYFAEENFLIVNNKKCRNIIFGLLLD